MYVQADQVDPLAVPGVEDLWDEGSVDPELVLLLARRGVLVGMGVDVGIDP